MAETPKQEIKLFYCYAHEDKALREELQIHLSGLRRQYRLTNWYDREILPGENWEKAIDKHLSTADVILLLISPHFVDSDYCYGKEMQRALERHHAGNCCAIPILLRPTFWEETPFSTIQSLPTNARPVTSWPDRYKAFHDVARGISMAIKALLTSRTDKANEQQLTEGDLTTILSAVIQLGPTLWLDLNRHRLIRESEEIILTAQETSVLRILVTAMQTSRAYLSAIVIAEQCNIDNALNPEHRIAQIISVLRRKLGDPFIIKGRHGLGYRLSPQ